MKRLIAAVIAVILILGGVLLWWNISLSPVNSRSTKTQTFVISKGDGIREIARNLHNDGLIRDQVAFFLLVKKLGLEKNIQAGSYNLSPSMSDRDMAEKLTLGREAEIRVTIPEGLRSEEILANLQKAGVDAGRWTVESELSSWKAGEGYYFPSSYYVPKNMSIGQLRQWMRKTFDQEFTLDMRNKATAQGMTLDQTVVMASIVEREANNKNDRQIVAGILLHRLKDNHPLEVDATLQYALGNPSRGWWPNDITQQELALKSPYNTRLNGGLPPSPICNPGLESLQAVANPAKTDYYFYLSDKNKVMHYAKTLQEHNQNIARYL